MGRIRVIAVLLGRLAYGVVGLSFLPEPHDYPPTVVYIRHRWRAAILANYPAPALGWVAWAASTGALNTFTPAWVSVLVSILPAGGAYALWLSVAARLLPWMRAHPPAQRSIKAGYRMPAYPTDPDAPMIVLGERHTRRIYRGWADLIYREQCSETYSPTPEWSVLPALSAVTGLLILGGVGSGKTSFVLKPAIFPVFAHPSKPGGLVMDSKGALVQPLAESVPDRAADFLPVGPKHQTKWNPLHQPESSCDVIADTLLQALENIRGKPYTSDSMWIRDGAMQLLTALIGLLRIANNYVTAAHVQAAVHHLDTITQGSDTPAAVADGWATDLLAGCISTLPAIDKAFADQHRQRLAAVYSQDAKFRGIYVSELNVILSPLTDAAVADLFCPTQADINMPDWAEVINQGLIVCLDCNQSSYPTLSLALGMLLKIGYQNAILARLDWAKSGRVSMDRYMALVVDEYQQFCSVKDAEYLALCRESRSITVFATQGAASIVRRVGDDNARVIFNSLRNKLALNQTDTESIKGFFGTTERSKTSTSINESVQDAAMTGRGKFAGHSTVAQSLSISSQREDAVPDELLRSLPVGQGILTAHDGHRTIAPHRVFLRASWAPHLRHADLHN